MSHFGLLFILYYYFSDFFIFCKYIYIFINKIYTNIFIYVYFVIVFAIFTRKGDKVEKIVNSKKSRQRQVAFNGPIEPNVVEVEANEEKSE